MYVDLGPLHALSYLNGYVNPIWTFSTNVTRVSAAPNSAHAVTIFGSVF